MIDPNAVRENLDEWLQNPSWADVYNGAPSEACRKYISMMFYASETEDEEAFEKLDELESGLLIDDLKYMMANSAGPEKARLAKKIAALEK